MARIVKIVLTVTIAMVFFLGLLLFALYWWVTGKFDTATIDTIFLYLSLPLTGVDKRYIVGFIFQVISVLAVTGLFTALFVRSYRRARILFVPTSALRCLMAVLAFALAGTSLHMLEKRYGWKDYFFPDLAFYTYFEDNVRQVKAEDVLITDDSRNLVLVIVESCERVLVDPKVFSPILLPRLNRYRDGNIGFCGARQVVGTEFSIASFFSMLYGVPLLTSLSGIRVVKDEQEQLLLTSTDGLSPLQNTSFLGILQAHGYAVELFRCADARFSSYDYVVPLAADKAKIFDYVYLKSIRDDYQGRENNWGFNDSYIYERVKERLPELAAAGKFVLIIQTVNTHQPGIFEPGMERPYGDYRDACIQADIMAGDLIEWIGRQSFGKNTTIAVVGDHLLGIPEVGPVDLSPISDRGIFTLIVNAIPPGDSVKRDRVFATWDLPATLIEAVGGTLPESRFGLGTSLFSDSPNLLERDGLSRYNRMIKKRSRLYNREYRW